jgi:hypothetical protein
MRFSKLLTAAAVAMTVLGAATTSLAKTVGTVLEVGLGAQLITASGVVSVRTGMQVNAGDTIKTNGTGRVQLLFGDDTKIAVGPGSQLVLDDILLRSNGSAKRFTINALGGTFRFISGKSPKEVYEINTPTATMGIRGTIFDFSVSRESGTSLVLFEGEVDLCLRSGSCKRASGACTLSRAGSSNLQVGIRGGTVKNRVLRDSFPYVASQGKLLDSFHAETNACGNIAAPKIDKAVKVPLPAPEPLPEPELEPELEPETQPESESGSADDPSSGSDAETGPGSEFQPNADTQQQESPGSGT